MIGSIGALIESEAGLSSARLVSESPPFASIEEELAKQPNRLDTERLRWVLDAKVRALTALCSFQGSGKGDVDSRNAMDELARQITALKERGS